MQQRLNNVCAEAAMDAFALAHGVSLVVQLLRLPYGSGQSVTPTVTVRVARVNGNHYVPLFPINSDDDDDTDVNIGGAAHGSGQPLNNNVMNVDLQSTNNNNHSCDKQHAQPFAASPAPNTQHTAQQFIDGCLEFVEHGTNGTQSQLQCVCDDNDDDDELVMGMNLKPSRAELQQQQHHHRSNDEPVMGMNLKTCGAELRQQQSATHNTQTGIARCTNLMMIVM